jgi:hypothetical protein
MAHLAIIGSHSINGVAGTFLFPFLNFSEDGVAMFSGLTIFSHPH